MLAELIHSLNKEELRFYKLYTQRYATGKDGLGTRLLDLIRKETDEQDEDLIFKKLYGEAGDKNTYYRLKNRLQEDICDTLTLLHFGKEETNDIHRLICVYNILYRKDKFELAYYFLRKAEKRALQANNFELLDMIYTNAVKLSNEIININPEEYVAKQTENALLINRMRQMDQVLAVLNYRIKLTQNFEKGNETLLKLVDKTVKDFAKDKTINENRGFQIKIYRAISQAMVQKQQFKELEIYLLQTYSSFQQKKWFNKDTHDVYLQMLSYIVNAFLAQNKFEEALEYLNILKVGIAEYDNLLYDKYLLLYYNSLIIIYQQKDSNKALLTLNEFEKINRKSKNSFYEQFIIANRALVYFSMDKFDDAIRTLTKLYVSDYYRQADISFKFHIEIAELIMQYEAGDYDTVNKRIKQIKKAYKGLLGNADLKTDKLMIGVIQSLVLTANKKIDSKSLKLVNNLLDELNTNGEGGTHVIKYAVWLDTLKKRRGT